MSLIYLTRRETFSASHRLHSSAMTPEENKLFFEKCNSENGHGHNYTLKVTVKGPVNPKTGVLMNLTTLKDLIHIHVLEKVDHKHLNHDVEEFKTLNPTTENVAIVIWNWLSPHLPQNILYEVLLEETENNTVIYRGEK